MFEWFSVECNDNNGVPFTLCWFPFSCEIKRLRQYGIPRCNLRLENLRLRLSWAYHTAVFGEGTNIPTYLTYNENLRLKLQTSLRWRQLYRIPYCIGKKEKVQSEVVEIFTEAAKAFECLRKEEVKIRWETDIVNRSNKKYDYIPRKNIL